MPGLTQKEKIDILGGKSVQIKDVAKKIVTQQRPRIMIIESKQTIQ